MTAALPQTASSAQQAAAAAMLHTLRQLMSRMETYVAEAAGSEEPLRAVLAAADADLVGADECLRE